MASDAPLSRILNQMTAIQAGQTAKPILRGSVVIGILCITFDSKRQFIKHLNNSLLKYRWILPRLTSTIKGQFGSTFSSGHKIYKRVVLPALLYGSGVWGKRAYDTNGARKLRSLHYKYAKAIIRGGPCTPTIPAISLTGCPPLDISIKAHIEYLKTLKTGHYESRPSPSFLPYPPLRKIIYFTKSLQLNVTTIYTDGSQSSEGVGAGVILPPPLQTIQLKLHQECSAFQAELLAILYTKKNHHEFPERTLYHCLRLPISSISHM
ncbi:hypothetical protein LAZ67_2001445 [Cordylochernes scorpioides]|uniref:Uncharacterized protein n=1 Tax=Cordylochernes scorpioides TaxID=51811 RepID=A0ABY6K4F4_9ARAC|nr:hypothetical protein LAZ67_2001445 [Cordylochernes scorpioides]